MTNRLPLIYTAICLVISTALLAQQKPIASNMQGYGKVNFTKLSLEEALHPPKVSAQKYIKFRRAFPNGITQKLPPNGNAQITNISSPGATNLPVPEAALTSPTPIKTFTGIVDNNTIIPPDVMGAAGPKYLMETLNSSYNIYAKGGASALTLSPATFWSAVGDFLSDPHIAYDSLTKRWIHCSIGSLANGDYAIFVAVSKTTDPRGDWLLYSLDTGPSSTLPDYPLLGFNKKWVVITTNDFVNNSFSKTRIIVMNKSKLEAGTLTTANLFFDNGIATLSPAETLDPNQGTEYLLADYNGNASGFGYVRPSTITGTADNPSYAAGSLIGVNQPWSENSLDAPQKGTTNRIDANDTRMGKIIVRNGSIWATQTAFLPANSPTHAAVQWWQINIANKSVIQFGRLDDPTAANWFSYPSIAVSASNDVLIGCTLFNKNLYASAAYAYRSSADPINTLQSFFKYKAGGNSYFKTFGGPTNRWGDYSATCMDYADGSFWTLQEFATATANTWGTWWAHVSAPAPAAIIAKKAAVESSLSNSSLTINPNPAKDMATVKWQSASSGEAMLSVINVQGAIVFNQKVQVLKNNNQQHIPLQNLGSGIYIIKLTMGNSTRSIKLIVEK